MFASSVKSLCGYEDAIKERNKIFVIPIQFTATEQAALCLLLHLFFLFLDDKHDNVNKIEIMMMNKQTTKAIETHLF